MLRVIDMAPQYLDIHQVLCEIYVRQSKIEQAITKYAILIDTYIVNGRVDDAISTYRRILQLEPNNLTYRVRLISLLASQGNKEDLLRERTLAAESYLRLGYMDRALSELEQALQRSDERADTPELRAGLAEVRTQSAGGGGVPARATDRPAQHHRPGALAYCHDYRHWNLSGHNAGGVEPYSLAIAG